MRLFPMAKNKSKKDKREIESYQHKDKERAYNPPVGLVTPETDLEEGKKQYSYDPHLDPQLVWAGKAEHTSFEVPTVSLHVHERIEPSTIIEAVRKKNGDTPTQMSLFASEKEKLPLREEIEFYKHKRNWKNRLIAGDSLLVMNSLLEKEGMAGKVQMVYIDPPYGITYDSNFQAFINNREVKDKIDEDLTAEPEMIKAFRDTWKLGIHSYLTYLRDRLLLSRALLKETGSVFVQISDENVHHVREIMDEVFGKENYISMIAVKRPTMAKKIIRNNFIFILWYARDKNQIKTHKLFFKRNQADLPGFEKKSLGLEHKKTGEKMTVTPEIRRNLSKYIKEWDVYQLDNLIAIGSSAGRDFPFEYKGKTFSPGKGKGWKVSKEGLNNLLQKDRIEARGGTLCFKNYMDDYPVVEISNLWEDTAGPNKEVIYVVQTKDIIISRCLLMTTDPGDLVLDPTCGSGTTAYVAEHWGRRWITCDTSRVALTLSKQRLMAATFDYFKLSYPEQGVSSGFIYKTVPHITLKSIANNPEIKNGMTKEEMDAAIKKYASHETLYDEPLQDTKKKRITGPFTVEAVPSPVVKPIEDIEGSESEKADESIARSGETLRQGEWRDELFKTGIRGKGGQQIKFARIEPLSGTQWLHAEGETQEDNPQPVVVSFGPEHAPLEQRQVALALEEAQTLVPKPKLVLFAAFQFDPEAAKDIDETIWPGVTLLKAQMNADLLTEDLKKKRASNESFWLIGQPDVELEKIAKGKNKNKFKVSVHGFDYYNTRTGKIESGGKDKIAMWMLDPDYDGRSLFPRQVFFPMADPKDGWTKLAKNLKSEIDEELIESYRGTESLPFVQGKNRRAAIKIIDDRGIESFKVIRLY